MANTTVALDAMGGDFGPSVVIPAALHSIKRHKNLSLILVGDSDVIKQQLKIHNGVESDRLKIQHSSQIVTMDELPSQALRKKKDSSMRVAINLVKDGTANACVSAGNTGALMMTARFVLKTIPGINRPAIIAPLPTRIINKSIRILDLGANVDSSPEHLLQFAIMGSVLISALEGNPAPKIGLLNIGEEEIKGNEQVKKTAELLNATNAINYIGYIEGTEIFKGIADVIVCDGFVGNVALKTAEGVADLITGVLKDLFRRNLITKFMAFIVMPILKRLGKRIDPGRFNGASLIGLRGTVIKSHGSADILAFANAIKEAKLEVEKDVINLITDQIAQILPVG